MSFRYLGEIATGDVAFEAWGEDRAAMIRAAGDAAMSVMVPDLESIAFTETREISVEDTDDDLLLLSVLQELIFFKDAQGLLLRISNATVTKGKETLAFTGTLEGERIDPTRHEMATDVKAVTMHRLSVAQESDRWRCTVVLDI